MSDLADFLLARIAEDEALARANEPERERHPYGDRGIPPVPFEQLGGELRGYLGGPLGEHAAAWHPARVLAECDAKRRIIEWHAAWPVLVEAAPTFDLEPCDFADRMTVRISRQVAWLTEREYVNRFGSEPPTGPVLRMMALPYADHADYRESWRP